MSRHPRSSHHGYASSSPSSLLAGAAGLLAAAACLASSVSTDSPERPSCDGGLPPPAPPAADGGGGSKRDGFPIISKAEVAKHKSLEAGGVWVTYAGGVYDITDFIASHPGGASKISMAAGGPLEPFWKLYALHMKDEVGYKSSGWCLLRLEENALWMIVLLSCTRSSHFACFSVEQPSLVLFRNGRMSASETDRYCSAENC